MNSSAPQPDRRQLVIGGADAELDSRLSAELDTYNFAASGVSNLSEFTVKAVDDAGELIAGLSGWTWGTCAGIGMVWVREDSRKAGWGGAMLEAAEDVARRRACRQILVSSFTFQAPSFYQGHGYIEFGRSEGLPVDGAADVHFVKTLP
jgi:GNAT superfamily N-acetyltransferase